MKLKVVIVDLEIPPYVKKWGCGVGIPMALLLGGATIARAAGLLTWTQGDVLNASDLNNNFSNVQSQIAALQTSVSALQTTLSSASTTLDCASCASATNATNALNVTGVATLKAWVTGTTQFYWQAGTAGCSASPCAIAFNKPFANGIVSILATQGDEICGTSLVLVPPSTQTLTGFQASTPGCPTPGVNGETIQWFAIGW